MQARTLRAALMGCAMSLSLAAPPALATENPTNADQIARPGGTLPGNPRIALVRVADGFQDPTNVANANDGSGRIFVTERVGRIRVVDRNGQLQPEPFLDLTNFNPLGTDVQTGFVEQGLYSVAFHPRFRENGYFFVHYASLPFNGDGVIVRLQVDPNNPNVVSAERIRQTAKVILRIEQPYYNHNGGQIEFGPDGFLYIGSGDGGWEGDPLDAGQDLNTLLGKVLRIDVDVPEDDGRAYRIPRDNPFATAAREQLMTLFGITEQEFSRIRTRSRPEIFAHGLRNPYEFSFDRRTGDLYIADVGQNHWEEIDWIPARSSGGQNFGWSRMMGSHCFPATGPNDRCAQVGLLPVAEYPHEEAYPGAPKRDEGSGCSALGLGVANNLGPESMYLVGDWCSGRVFALGWDDGARRWQLQELAKTDLQFTGGGYDEDGNVLAVNSHNFYIGEQGATQNPPGSLWRVVRADQVPQGAVTARTATPQPQPAAAPAGQRQ
jgi:glucose/arabinose dehydrogenase